MTKWSYRFFIWRRSKKRLLGKFLWWISSPKQLWIPSKDKRVTLAHQKAVHNILLGEDVPTTDRRYHDHF